jgi:hypothetical protein
LRPYNYNASLFRLAYFSIHFVRQKILTLRLSLQHAVLHNDFVVCFQEYAPTPIPKSGLAVAVARARARDHVRQAQLAAGETDVDELVVWQVKLSHHRCPSGQRKLSHFCSPSRLQEQLKIAAKATAQKTFPAALIVLTTRSRF